MSKRINGIGTLDGAALTLTHAATVAGGHLLAEGVDGGDAGREARRDARIIAQRAADDLGKSVEIYASRKAGGFVVDVVTAQ